ncbi:MAG TPA: glutaredoxin family protein [Candidatus Saccharimonadales bacterium]|jgi:glutaredoxin 3
MSTITVYTRTACPYCELVKKFLDAKGANYTTINMEETPNAMQEVLSATGRTIAPTTIIEKVDGTKEIVVGFNLGKIAPAIA